MTLFGSYELGPSIYPISDPIDFKVRVLVFTSSAIHHVLSFTSAILASADPRPTPAEPRQSNLKPIPPTPTFPPVDVSIDGITQYSYAHPHPQPQPESEHMPHEPVLHKCRVVSEDLQRPASKRTNGKPGRVESQKRQGRHTAEEIAPATTVSVSIMSIQHMSVHFRGLPMLLRSD